MKKFVSLALAVMMIAAMAVTAFAAVDSIALDKDENGVVLGQSLLTPGATYKFPILIAKDGAENADFTEADMDGHKFEITVTKGAAAISTPKVVQEDGKYYLTFTTASAYGVTAVDTAVKVRYMSRNPLKELASLELSFSVGHSQVSDEAIDALSPGEALEISPSAPVLTAKQLEAFAKLNQYKAVTFAGSGWTFTGKVNNMNGLNLYTTQAPVMEIVRKYEDNQFKFLSFSGKPKFDEKGSLTIDVTDVEQQFDGQFFLYKYQDNRLYKLKFTYDEGAGTISFTPSDLGSYVITDKEITDVQLGGSGSSSSGSSSSGSSSGSQSGETNPETGAPNGFGALSAAALGMTVLALAVSVRKK